MNSFKTCDGSVGKEQHMQWILRRSTFHKNPSDCEDLVSASSEVLN